MKLLMSLKKRLSHLRQDWVAQRAYWQRQTIEIIAYQLYQERILLSLEGDECTDWRRAQEISQNPLRRLIHYDVWLISTASASLLIWCRSGVAGKTAWQWLELLIIPVFLAGGAFYLENQIETRQENIADQRAKQEILSTYFEQMKTLLLSEGLRESAADSEVRSVARAITVTTIRELDSDRNALIISFLKESNLIRKAEGENSNALPILSSLNFSNAKLREVDFRDVDLRSANFSGAYIHKALFQNADLRDADFNSANLSEANFRGADLSDAFLAWSDLSYASLADADLRGATIADADFKRAYLADADLRGTSLYNFDLRNASLCRTKLPERVTLDPNRNC